MRVVIKFILIIIKFNLFNIKKTMMYGPPSPREYPKWCGKANQNKKPTPIVKSNNNINKNKNNLDKDQGKRNNYDKPWLNHAKVRQQENEEQKKDFLKQQGIQISKENYEMVESLQREVMSQIQTVSFDDIAGLENIKSILKSSILFPLARPDLFQDASKGVILFGPPGTGKTMLAKAVASYKQTTFFNVKIASLGSKWRGESEKLIVYLFELAKFYSPSIMFFDEIDAICSARNDSSNSADKRVLNTMLQEMDGTTTDKDTLIMIIAAINLPWQLDEAVKRRLSKRVRNKLYIVIPLPNDESRKQLFELYLKKNKHEGVDLNKLVSVTKGYSCDDLAKVCPEASQTPINKQFKLHGLEQADKINKDDIIIQMSDFEEVLKRIKPSVNNKDLKKHDQYMQDFGSN